TVAQREVLQVYGMRLGEGPAVGVRRVVAAPDGRARDLSRRGGAGRVVAMLEQDGVVTAVRELDLVARETAAARNRKDAAAARARVHLADVNVAGRPLAADLAGVVRDPERRVALRAAVRAILAVDDADLGVDGSVQEYSRLGRVGCVHATDF